MNWTMKTINKAFDRFKTLADLKKEVFDEDLDAIVADEIMRATEKYKLGHITVTCGSFAVATATVQLEINGTAGHDRRTGRRAGRRDPQGDQEADQDARPS